MARRTAAQFGSAHAEWELDAGTGRGLLKTLCDDDPDRFGGISGRFASPVFPGEELLVRMWELDDGAAFQAVGADGNVVFDAGRFTFS